MYNPGSFRKADLDVPPEQKVKNSRASDLPKMPSTTSEKRHLELLLSIIT